MTPQSQAGMLFARLQLVAPAARSILLAAPRGDLDTGPASRRLAAAIAETGHNVRLIDLSRPDPVDLPPGVTGSHLSSGITADLEAAGRALREADGYTVVSGGGLLESPPTLLMAAAADAVVIAAGVGRSYRDDLALARSEVERSGGRLVGAILLD